MTAKYRFGVTNRDRTVLVVDNKAVIAVEDMIGFEYVRSKVIDVTVDNMNIAMNTTEPEILKALTGEKKPETPKKPPITVSVAAALVNYIVGASMSVIGLVTWLMGIVIAPGWFKLYAIPFPPYAWYLVTETFMKMYHVI